MGRAIRSHKAVIDLWEIADYIAQNNLSAAVDFLAEVDEVIARLSDFPGLGPGRDELHAGLRSFPIGNYVLFYRRIPGGVEIVRVFHGARDLDELFDE
jgi:toxin ParE1/3/4